MTYLLAKAAHIVSLFVWIAGMAAVALSLRHPVRTLMKPLRAYDRAVTTPAMILAWGFGLFLAVRGGWFPQSWLGLKILLVLALSGVHGALTGKLRRATDTTDDAVAGGQWFLPIGLILVSGCVLLATLKP